MYSKREAKLSVLRFGREDNVVGLHALVNFFRAAAVSRARTSAAGLARPGLASRASQAAATSVRSQASTAWSRAISARKPSRMTSLSVAYSPEATLPRTVSAMS